MTPESYLNKPLIVASNSEDIEIEFQKTVIKNTYEGYQKFIDKYPNTKYAKRAETILMFLDGQEVGKKNTIESPVNENSNLSYDSFKDSRDRKVYKTVQIGNQVWMAENLAYIPSSGNYWAFNNNTADVAVYGYLYDWETAKKVCPSGWHLPSDTEWTELTDYLGGWSFAGGKLKEIGTTHWSSPNTGATNETGFSALPGGYRYSSGGMLGHAGSHGYWWSSTENKYSSSSAYRWFLYYNYASVYKYGGNKSLGFSVRCVRD